MKFVRFIALLLVLVGALNWGLWGFAKFDIIAWIFGSNISGWARICYALIGIAGLYSIRLFFAHGVYGCCCKKSSCCTKDEEPPKDE
jgi:uncharacterized protein